jgi:hypothetical protein
MQAVLATQGAGGTTGKLGRRPVRNRIVAPSRDRFSTRDSGLLRATPGYSGYFFEKKSCKTSFRRCARMAPTREALAKIKLRQGKTRYFFNCFSNQIKPNQDAASAPDPGQLTASARCSSAKAAGKLQIRVNVGKSRYLYAEGGGNPGSRTAHYFAYPPVPEGLPENSPAVYCRDRIANGISPEGTAELFPQTRLLIFPTHCAALEAPPPLQLFNS